MFYCIIRIDKDSMAVISLLYILIKNWSLPMDGDMVYIKREATYCALPPAIYINASLKVPGSPITRRCFCHYIDCTIICFLWLLTLAK